MNKTARKKQEIAQDAQTKDYGRFAVLAVFVVILIVYSVTLFMLFPGMPITTRQADMIPGYDRYYPPFRTDEFNYYNIAQHILTGGLYQEGSFERAYPLGFPLAAAPFIAVLGERGGYVANILITMLSLYIFYIVIRRYNKRSHVLALVIVMAFATLNWFYADSCYSEPLSQLLLILTLYLMERGKNSPKSLYFFLAAGIVTGFNLFVRPHYVLIGAPFFVSLWLSGKSRYTFKNAGILYGCGIGAVVAVWMVRNSFVFGSPLTFEYTRMITQFLPGNPAPGVKGNVFTGSHRLLFDEYHGLLTITPILLIFPAGLRAMWQRGLKNESVTFLVTAVMMALVFASGPYPFTEFGLGSRHLMPLYPLMMIPAVFYVDDRMFTRGMVLALALYSFYHAGLGWFTGTFPGLGYFPGFLNDAHARAIILSRKNALPKRTFKSADELYKMHLESIKSFDMYKYLQTLSPEVRKEIEGKERDFFLFWRFHQEELRSKIQTMDPVNGITYEGFTFVDPNAAPAVPPDSSATGK
ncbi:glycosyltransferase family 39 protein [bacterium]|nr:glycosyltransferase family 39 protein [bacterium]